MIKIIPEPQRMNMNSNKFVCFEEVNVVFDEEIGKFPLELCDFIKEKTSFNLGDNGYKITFVLEQGQAVCGFYKIKIEKQQMTLLAYEKQGLYYAMQTAKQLLANELYEGEIEDYPQNNFRSFMLDVGRYYYPIEDIMKIIDYISLYKFNYFHMHLTDDQGWRFEVKKYPKLTEIGSHRSHTNFNLKPEGGYYTQEQLKYIVEYCHSKFIKVIPEIDMPGHTISAIASYPELSCFDRQMKVATHWGVKFDVMCAGKDFTYQFCRDIIDELCEIFTDDYIHIGGDEVPKERWTLCEHCQTKIKEFELEDMEQLQLYFANTIAEYVKSKGKKVIMWDIDYPKQGQPEPKYKLSDDIIIQWWETNKNISIADKINSGRRVICANSGAYYIDLPYGYISLENAYNEESLKSIHQSQLVGLETCLWTEYVKNLKKVKFNTFPRLLAISEIFWTGEEKRNYQKFLSKLKFSEEFLNKYDIKMPRKGVYKPNTARKFFSKMWFERRQLTWQGLHLICENARIKRKFKKV